MDARYRRIVAKKLAVVLAENEAQVDELETLFREAERMLRLAQRKKEPRAPFRLPPGKEEEEDQ